MGGLEGRKGCKSGGIRETEGSRWLRPLNYSPNDSAFHRSHWEALTSESWDLIYVNFKNTPVAICKIDSRKARAEWPNHEMMECCVK